MGVSEWIRVIVWVALSSIILAAGLRMRRKSQVGYVLIAIAVVCYIVLILGFVIFLTSGTDGRWI